MDKHPESENHEIDKPLADFTDRLWSAESQAEPAHQEQDPELNELEKTVVRIKKAFGSRKTDPEMADRIRQKLVAEWKKTGMDKPRLEARKISSPRRKGWISSKYTLLQLGFSLVLLVVVLIILVPEVQTGLFASAFKNLGVIPLLVLIVAVIAVLLVYFRKK